MRACVYVQSWHQRSIGHSRCLPWPWPWDLRGHCQWTESLLFEWNWYDLTRRILMPPFSVWVVIKRPKSPIRHNAPNEKCLYCQHDWRYDKTVYWLLLWNCGHRINWWRRFCDVIPSLRDPIGQNCVSVIMPRRKSLVNSSTTRARDPSCINTKRNHGSCIGWWHHFLPDPYSSSQIYFLVLLATG
jgi:hypothetical protein